MSKLREALNGMTANEKLQFMEGVRFGMGSLGRQLEECEATP